MAGGEAMRRQTRHYAAAALLLAGLLGAAGTAIAEDVELTGVLQKDLVTLRDYIKNAEVKLSRGAVGMSSGGGAAEKTIAEKCCAGNLKRFDATLTHFDGVVEALRGCYRKGQDTVGQEVIELVDQDSVALGRGITIFRTSTDAGQARGALAGTTRAYLNLVHSAEELPACTAPAPPEGESGD
jgi:hypothetical protein